MAEFSWAAAGDVGLGLLGGATKALQSAGRTAVAQANARAANTVREGQNDVRRSGRNLAATVRTINNDRILAAAGDQLDTLTRNAVRTSDSFTRGKFENSIKDAEQWGASAARASASGLGGAGIEAISQVTSMQIARRQEAYSRTAETAVGDAAERTEGVYSKALQQLDLSPLTASLDQNHTAVPAGDNLAGFLIGGLLDKKDSLSVMLGSLYTNNGVPTSGAPPAAVTSPVTTSTATGTDLAPFKWDEDYDDAVRKHQLHPTPYANSIDALNTTRN